MKIFRLLRWLPITSIFIFIATIAILGKITPEYNPMAHTISRLSITKNGYIATINLIQLGIGSLILGIQLAQVVQAKRRYFQILPFFLLATIMLFGVALAPTDYIDIPQQILTMSKTAWLHFAAVGMFIVLCPATVFTLVRGFASDPNWKTLTTITVVMMVTSVLLSITWLWCFLNGYGWFLPYRGMAQKAIALWTLGWTLLVAFKAAREQR